MREIGNGKEINTYSAPTNANGPRNTAATRQRVNRERRIVTISPGMERESRRKSVVGRPRKTMRMAMARDRVLGASSSSSSEEEEDEEGQEGQVVVTVLGGIGSAFSISISMSAVAMVEVTGWG